MSEELINPQRAYCLIKFFSKEEHYILFKSGRTILRTPHYYRMCEDAGRGDRAESCIGYWDRKLGHQIPGLLMDGKPVDTADIASLLVYPAREQRDSWLQSWGLIGPDNRFEEALPRMVEEFGPYFVILPSIKIADYANMLAKESKLDIRYGLIQYSENPAHRSLTTKDSEFAYQREFRFYLGACEKNETQDKHIYLDGVDSLLSDAGTLKFQSPDGSCHYFSLGAKSVVTTP